MTFSTYLGPKEGERVGSYTGVTRRGCDWVVTLHVNDKDHHVGIFWDVKHAALAYDMEALRAFGRNATNLNFKYQILNDVGNGNKLKLLDRHGLTLVVDVFSDPTEYTSVTVDPCARKKSILSVRDGQAVVGRGAPQLPDRTDAWDKRSSTLYTPTASFCYDITFPHTKSLGLNLKPNYIHYSPQSDNYIGILVVVEAMTLLSSLVYPGDIILQINGSNMSDFGSKFNFDHMTSLITSATPPRTVKFLRPTGPCHTLSPAEICLYLGLCPNACTTDLAHVVPKNPLPPMAKFNVVVSSTGSSQSLQLVYLDNKIPLAIKRLMQGMKVNWEGNPLQKPPDTPKAAAENSVLSQEGPNQTQEIFQEHDKRSSCSEVTASHRKWVAQLVLPPLRNMEENCASQQPDDTSVESPPAPDTSTFGALTDEKFGGSSTSEVSLKRKREESLYVPTQAELLFRKKMNTEKLHERVYFLGKYDSESEARAVLAIAKKEAKDNGGIFHPHKISPSLRSSTSQSSISSTHPTHASITSTTTPGAAKNPLTASQSTSSSVNGQKNR